MFGADNGKTFLIRMKKTNHNQFNYKLKKFNTMKKFKFGLSAIFGLLLFATAVLFGASTDISMAMADQFIDNSHTQQTPGPTETPGVNGDLTGTPMSATLVNESDLAAREMDKMIAKHRPWKFSATTDMYNKARRVTCTKYEIEHPVSAATVMDCQLGANAGGSNQATITLNTASSHITVDELRMFAPGITVLVQGVDGWTDDKTNPQPKGILVMMVTERTSSTCTMIPLNGKWVSTNYVVPAAIPAGTTLSVMSSAGSESQLEVAPEDYIPETKTVYLQKKIVNIVMTDDFKEQIKELPFYNSDLKDNALYNFRRKAERTLWAGVASKKKMFVSEKIGWEDVYTSEGILAQLLNKFAISGDKITFEDLIDICRIQFGKDSVSDEAEAYSGLGFLARLHKIDFQKTGDVTMLTQRDTFGIMISKFQCSFGTLNFKKTPALDDLGYSECCAIVDMANATRYVKIDKKSLSVDMKKGGGPGGEVREASRDIYIEADALCLRGYNSMLVGPAEKVFNFDSVNPTNSAIFKYTAAMKTAGYNLEPDMSKSTSVFNHIVALSLGAANFEPTDGDLWYLEAADTFSHFAAGTLIKYNAGTGGWEKHSGSITA